MTETRLKVILLSTFLLLAGAVVCFAIQDYSAGKKAPVPAQKTGSPGKALVK